MIISMGLKFGIFIGILLLGLQSHARLFVTIDDHYARQRLDDLVVTINNKPFTAHRSKAFLDAVFTTDYEKRLIKEHVAKLRKFPKHKLFVYDDRIELTIDGKKFTTFSDINPLNNTIKINSQDITLEPSRGLMKIRQDIKEAIEPGLGTATKKWFVISKKDKGKRYPYIQVVTLFVVIPIAYQLPMLTFENELKKVNQLACKKPGTNIREKFPHATLWLTKMDKFLNPSKGKFQTCDRWVANSINNKGILQEEVENNPLEVERRTYLCKQARRTISCVPRTLNTPFGRNPNSLLQHKKNSKTSGKGKKK